MKPSRRDFLKWTSALVVGSAFHGLGKAQSGTIKIGFVSPRTGPLRPSPSPTTSPWSRCAKPPAVRCGSGEGPITL